MDTFKMEVARQLQAFEQAVAVELAELRNRVNHQRLEIAKIRAELRLLEFKLLESKHVSAVTLYGEDVDQCFPLAGELTAGGEVQLAAAKRPGRPRVGRCWPRTSMRRSKY